MKVIGTVFGVGVVSAALFAAGVIFGVAIHMWVEETGGAIE